MKNRFFSIMLSFLFLVPSAATIAQEAIFDDVFQINLRNMGPILENDQVKGYYMFYKVDKADRNNDNYLLTILDENAKAIASKPLVRSQDLVLAEAAYNGKSFAFAFLNNRRRSLEVLVLDRQGEEVGKRTFQDLNKYDLARYMYLDPEAQNANISLFPLGSEGFVRYGIDKGKKIGYEIKYLHGDLGGNNEWRKVSGSDEVEAANYVGSSDDFLVSVIGKTNSIWSRDMDMFLQVVNAKDGETLFEKELKIAGNDVSFSGVFIENDEITILGEYFAKGDNWVKDKSKGIAILRFNKTGDELGSNKIPWTSGFRKHIELDDDGKIDNGGLVFHKVIQSSNGNIFMVAEEYQKKASAGGIAGMALGGGSSAVKLQAFNTFVLELTPDYELSEVHIFEKPKSNIEVPPGSMYLSSSMLANMARSFGLFDYSFTTFDEDQSTFFSTFLFTEKEKGKKRELVCNTIIHDSAEGFSVDKFPISTEATHFEVFPAKPGYILLAEYFKKDKKLNLRLEKVNY